MLAGAALASAPLAAQGDPTSVAQAATSDQWQIDYGEYRCTLSRSFGEAAPISVGIRMVPGDENADLIIVNPAWARETPLPQRVEVVFRPSGARFGARALSGPAPSTGHRFMRVSAVDRSFFEEFAGAAGMSLEGWGGELLSVDLTETESALRALRACHDDLMRSWGVDPSVIAGVRQRPEPLGRTAAMMASEEPLSAQDTPSSFFVIIRYTVGTDGRVRACDVVRTGGYPQAAGMLCQRARSEARYRPAIGSDGQPVAVQFIQTTTLLRRP